MKFLNTESDVHRKQFLLAVFYFIMNPVCSIHLHLDFRSDILNILSSWAYRTQLFHAFI